MKRLYRIKPIGHYRIWGSDTLGDQFHLTNPRSIGEISCASANSSCDCEIYEEAYTLSDFYKNHPEYFHLSCKQFPLRINIMAANEDLSIQVHPEKHPQQTLSRKPGMSFTVMAPGYVWGTTGKRNRIFWMRLLITSFLMEFAIFPVPAMTISIYSREPYMR